MMIDPNEELVLAERALMWMERAMLAFAITLFCIAGWVWSFS